MAERKVFSKYYAPDFDPTKLKRVKLTKEQKLKAKIVPVRLALPMSVRCLTCGEFMGAGKKFNAHKEVCEENYLGIRIFRFYMRCTKCLSKFTMKTDPKNTDYLVETGAKRNFEAADSVNDMGDKIAGKKSGNVIKSSLAELEEEELDADFSDDDDDKEDGNNNNNNNNNDDNDEGRGGDDEDNFDNDAMKALEKKTMVNKREMMMIDALDEQLMANAKLERFRNGTMPSTVLGLIASTPNDGKQQEQQKQQKLSEDDEKLIASIKFGGKPAVNHPSKEKEKEKEKEKANDMMKKLNNNPVVIIKKTVNNNNNNNNNNTNNNNSNKSNKVIPSGIAALAGYADEDDDED